MTTHTQLAMFAIAAFALGGMAFAPAFANGAISKDITMSYGYNTIANSDIGCGSSDQCKMSASAFAGINTDYWVVSFGPDGNTTCDVEILVNGGTSWDESKTFYNLDYETSTTIYGPTDIEVSDEFTVSAVYTNCS